MKEVFFIKRQSRYETDYLKSREFPLFTDSLYGAIEFNSYTEAANEIKQIFGVAYLNHDYYYYSVEKYFVKA